jgi:hypothetical protein
LGVISCGMMATPRLTYHRADHAGADNHGEIQHGRS